jgi:hypothetical protein
VEISVENVEFSNLAKRFPHLSQEHMINLMKKYYDGEKVANILEEFNVRISVSQLYSIFPSMITDENCIHCASTILDYTKYEGSGLKALQELKL